MDQTAEPSGSYDGKEAEKRRVHSGESCVDSTAELSGRYDGKEAGTPSGRATRWVRRFANAEARGLSMEEPGLEWSSQHPPIPSMPGFESRAAFCGFRTLVV